MSNPRIQKDSKGVYLIEVPYPLAMDRLRHKIRQLGFISDGSFSGSIAKIPYPALLKLIEELIPAEHQENIYQQLVEQGAPDKSISGFVKAVLANIGGKIASDTGEEISDNIGETIGQIFNGWVSKDIISDD